MSDGLLLLMWFGGGPVLCAVIASVRGMEWWVGALLGILGCVGLVIVCVMKPGGRALAHIPPPAPNSQWAPDPTRRHELRLWDGQQWTPNVSDQGRSGWDPMQ